MKRRNFLVTALGGLLATGCAGPARTIAPVSRPWGLQLFTVGALLAQDFEGTLGKVAAAGYREVETVGSFGKDPVYLRAQLDRFGLVSPSQHIASDEVYASFGAWTRKEITTEQNRENYERAFGPDRAIAIVRDAIGKAKPLGQNYVTWPILMPRMLTDRAILDTYIRLFNEAGRICREEGLVFGFHNHDREFKTIGDELIYDLILAGTDPELVKMEMDFYWVTKAGKDAIPYFKANPGRYYACHVKDMDETGAFAAAGTGILDLPKLIGAARESGVRHFFVEYDRSDDPMAVIGQAIGYLKDIE